MARFDFQIQQGISTVTFVLIAIRLYIRCYLRRRFPNLSDYFVISAWIMYFIPVIIDEIVVPASGLSDEELGYAIWYRKWVYYWFIQYFTIYYAIKASLLLFYSEWIPRSLERLWMSNRVLMVITGICYAYTALIQIFRCQPISINWTDPGVCMAAQKFYVFVSISVLHLFTDVLIYILPVFVLYYMTNVPLSKKAGAAFMFLLGIISIFFSALRFGLSMWSIFHPESQVSLRTIFISQNLDESAGVFVVCCPALKIFLQRCWTFWKDIYARRFGGKDQRLNSSDLNQDGMMMGKVDKGDVLTITVSSTVAVVTQHIREMEEGNVNSPRSSKSYDDDSGQTVFPYPSSRNTMETTYEEITRAFSNSRW